jgi:hypothetical protein
MFLFPIFFLVKDKCPNMFLSDYGSILFCLPSIILASPLTSKVATISCSTCCQLVDVCIKDMYFSVNRHASSSSTLE